MNESRMYGRSIGVLAGAMLLCGSMGMAQAGRDAGAQAPGQTPGQPSSIDSRMNAMQQPNQPSAMDRMFVSKALQGDMAEIQLAQLTLQKSQNQQVKDFAQHMIDDHTKLQEQMKPVAQQLGVAVPDVSKKDRSTMAKMQTLSGSAYDQAYIKDMVKDHKQDLSQFQMEASSGQDQTVKDAAAQGSKVISLHLQMAQQLAKDQNVTMASK